MQLLGSSPTCRPGSRGRLRAIPGHMGRHDATGRQAVSRPGPVFTEPSQATSHIHLSAIWSLDPEGLFARQTRPDGLKILRGWNRLPLLSKGTSPQMVPLHYILQQPVRGASPRPLCNWGNSPNRVPMSPGHTVHGSEPAVDQVCKKPDSFLMGDGFTLVLKPKIIL